MITVQDFIREFKNKRVMNTKTDDTIVSNYIRETLQVKEYLPFKQKRAIVEMIVRNHITEVNGIKKYDHISAYVSFVVAMLTAHTILEFGDDPVEDYDMLAAADLLNPIIETFAADHGECDVLLKMALGAEMEDNSVSALVGKFLNGLTEKLGGVMSKLESVDMKDIFGANFNDEDLAKLKSFLNK